MDNEGFTRRSLIRSGLLIGAGSAMPLTPVISQTHHRAENESFWASVRACFSPSPRYVDLEGGVLNFMPGLVRNKFDYLRDECALSLKEDPDTLSNTAADLVSSTLNLPLQGMLVTNGHQATCTLAVQTLIEHAEKSSGGTIVCIKGSGLLQRTLAKAPGQHSVVLIDPWYPDGTLGTAESIIDSIRSVKNPRALVLAYADAVTGLALPFQEILAFAQRSNLLTAADPSAILSRLSLEFSSSRPDILVIDPSRWLGAPAAVGLMYSQMRLNMPALLAPQGVPAISSLLAFPEVFAFYRAIGAQSIRNRQQHLNRLWLDVMPQRSDVRVLTASVGQLDLATAAIRLQRVKDVAQRLLDRHGYITYPVEHASLGGLLRVMPNISQNSQDLERFPLALMDSLS